MLIRTVLTVICFATAAASAETSTTQAKANQARKSRVDLVSGAKVYLLTCGAAYQTYAVMKKMDAMLAESREGLARSQARFLNAPVAVQETESSDPRLAGEFADCLTRAKVDMIAMTRQATTNKLNAGSTPLIKEIVAQWITAIDSIPKRNRVEESSKFETLANRLLLDL